MEWGKNTCSESSESEETLQLYSEEEGEAKVWRCLLLFRLVFGFFLTLAFEICLTTDFLGFLLLKCCGNADLGCFCEFKRWNVVPNISIHQKRRFRNFWAFCMPTFSFFELKFHHNKPKHWKIDSKRCSPSGKEIPHFLSLFYADVLAFWVKFSPKQLLNTDHSIRNVAVHQARRFRIF